MIVALLKLALVLVLLTVATIIYKDAPGVFLACTAALACKEILK